MQDITEVTNYSEILSGGDYSVEWAIDIGEAGRLITHQGDYLTFGGDRILIGTGGADNGFGEDLLKSVSVTNAMFGGTPVLGQCVSAEVDIEMLIPEMQIPRMAQIRVFNRIFNSSLTSGWLDQGVFYIDTRSYDNTIDGIRTLKLHGFDAMLMTEQAYVWNLETGATDIEVVNDIAEQLQFSVDPRTAAIMTKGYTIESEQVGQYSMREMLGYLAGAYAGSFIMTPTNELRLVQLTTVPPETNYLAVFEGTVAYALTFGGDRILV